MNCFCGMVDRRNVLILFSNRDHCQISSPSRISNKPRAGFEPAQNLSSGFVKWRCAVVIAITPQRHIFRKSSLYFNFGQCDCRKSDLARPNSRKAVLREISQDWRYLITVLLDISEVVITHFQGRTQGFCHI